MISLQEKINELKPYVTGIRFIDNISVVDVTLKDGWVVPKSEIILTTKDAQAPNYYVFYSEDENISIDNILEFVKESININIEKEQKKEYFKVRVEELKILFRTNDLKDLMNLKFEFDKVDLNDYNDENIVDSHLETITAKNEDFEPINQELVNSLEVIEPIIENNVTNNIISDSEVENFNKSFSDVDSLKRNANGKLVVEVEDFSIPNNGFCNHSSELVCPNCMENM